ncbi:Flap endonuclease 1 [Portunus trituberculatus]|uniref:Flap endonuclease 1 n=1 Tax=Portunus trituberculatus TaxID=210409 RepID=A0A5B7JC36_PORTR|nr:Flap endonuclease 1 [Portunus trituberculatus]
MLLLKCVCVCAYAEVEVFVLQLKWSEPQEEKLVEFMCGEKGFSEDRIRNGIKKLTKARNTTTQGRLDSFFKVLPSPTTNANKRKSEEKPGAAKKARGGKGKFGKGR